jgi:hypothetical protein
MNDCAGMNGKPQVIRFEMGTDFISTEIVVETRPIAQACAVCSPVRDFDYRAVERHAGTRLRQWLCAKHKRRGRATKAVSSYRPASGAGPCPTYYSDKQLSVGDLVTLSPRVGCAKRACPV